MRYLSAAKTEHRTLLTVLQLGQREEVAAVVHDNTHQLAKIDGMRGRIQNLTHHIHLLEIAEQEQSHKIKELEQQQRHRRARAGE